MASMQLPNASTQMVFTLQRKGTRRLDARTNDALLKWENNISGHFGGKVKIKVTERPNNPRKSVEDNEALWVYMFDLAIVENENPKIINRERIQKAIENYGTHQSWGKSCWYLENSPEFIPEDKLIVPNEEEEERSNLIPFEVALTWEEFAEAKLEWVKAIEHSTNADIAKHPTFKGLYNLEAQIRILASSVRTAMETDGRLRNHVDLNGPPGCGKTSIVKAFFEGDDGFPIGSWITFAADSATKAGYQKMFLQELERTGVPPMLALEEVDKTSGEALGPFLSALDRRGVMQKTDARTRKKIDIKSLCWATVNDVNKYRDMLAGALYSRMTKHIRVPQPTYEIITKILHREIEEFFGDDKKKHRWVEPCIELAKELRVHDPRTIIGFLDGGDRLLDNTYQSDLRATWGGDMYDKEELQQLAEKEINNANNKLQFTKEYEAALAREKERLSNMISGKSVKSRRKPKKLKIDIDSVKTTE
jgi:hypothetical protein